MFCYLNNSYITKVPHSFLANNEYEAS